MIYARPRHLGGRNLALAVLIAFLASLPAHALQDGVRSGSGRSGTGRGTSERGSRFTTTIERLDNIKPGLWETWWIVHRDEIIGRTMGGDRTLTAARGPLAGRGRRHEELPRDRVDDVVSEILPILLRVVRFEGEPWMLERALVSVAKVTPVKHRKTIAGYITNQLVHDDLKVKIAAALGLGILRDIDSQEILSALARDSEEGREFASGPVPWQLRSIATLGLGMTSPSHKTGVLVALMNDESAPIDTRSCAAIALGLTTGDTERHALQALLAAATSEGDDRVRAHAFVSLGKLGDTTAIPTILETIDERRVDNGVRQSAVIAAGLLADTTHAFVVHAVAEQVRKGKSEALRGYALMSLARILGRSDANPDLDEAPLAVLVDGLRRPRRPTDRPWAALALGVVGWQRGQLPDSIRVHLRAEHERATNPGIKGACALALGLAHDSEAGDDLHEAFVEERREVYRGYAATALGLLGHTAVEDVLLDELVSVGTPTDLRLQLATALSLLASPEATETVLAVMLEEPSDEMGWALARALGRLDDMDAVAGLSEIVENLKASVTPRSLACASLGFIGELALERWSTAFVSGYNFEVPVETLDAILQR